MSAPGASGPPIARAGAAGTLDGVACLLAGADGARAGRIALGLAAAGARVVRTGHSSSRADAETAAAAAEAQLGPLGALVCLPAAGEPVPIGELEPATFDATVADAFRSPFLHTQALLPRLRAAGRGRLVYVTSTLAISGRPCTAHLAAAEHAVVGLMRTATLETEPPLTANAVATTFDPEGAELDRLVDALALLLRPASDYLTGQMLKTAGGAELHA